MNRDDILNVLREGVVDFTFKKADGSLRNMSATLDVNLIPFDHLPKTDGNAESKEVKVNEAVVKCFDVDAVGWRSFKVDSLTEFAGIKVIREQS